MISINKFFIIFFSDIYFYIKTGTINCKNYQLICSYYPQLKISLIRNKVFLTTLVVLWSRDSKYKYNTLYFHSIILQDKIKTLRILLIYNSQIIYSLELRFPLFFLLKKIIDLLNNLIKYKFTTFMSVPSLSYGKFSYEVYIY